MPKRKAEEVTDEAKFRSYKVCLADADGWNFREWCEALLDPAHEYLAVTHTQGKDGKFHGHLVCVPKVGVKHTELDKAMEAPHPGRAATKGGKFFQTRNKFYDRQHFEYALKPAEWSDQGKDMIVCTSFTDGEIEAMVERSEAHHESLRTKFPDVIARLPCEGVSAEQFHLNAISACFKILKAEDRQPHPSLPHQIRMCCYVRPESEPELSQYGAYICKKYR